MVEGFKRRDLLKASAVFAAAAATGGFSCIEIASAAPIDVPTVDKLSMRVLVDQQHDQFLRGSTVNGVVHEGPGPARSADARNVLHNEWGLSLFLESQRDNEQRTILLDFGYTSPAIINNIGPLEGRPEQNPGADRQSWTHRSLWRPDWLSGQVSQRASGRPEALCGRRGQFLSSRQPHRHARPVRRGRHPRSC